MKSDLQWLDAQVVALRDLTPTVREILLRPLDGEPLPYGPGAHLQVELELSPGEHHLRHYSLVGEPAQHAGRAAWRIAVKRMDDGRGGSRAMWALAVGDSLRVSAPQNHFPLDLGASAYLLVAGGIGITPLVLMAQRLAARAARGAGDARGGHAGAPVRMLYGARGADELAYGESLRALLGDALVLHTGAAPMDFATEIAALPPGGQLYTCGPVPMMQALQAAWAAAGRRAADLRLETFGSSGRLPAQGFQVKVPRHGLVIEVPPGRSLLDALEAAGVEALSGCRRGECGLCTMDVLAVDGEIDHRDMFLSEHEKRAGQRICACVSRAVGCLTLDSAWRPDA